MMLKRMLLLVVCALVLAACSGVPNYSDPVVVGSPPTGGEGSDGISGIQPGGPENGASGDEIVRGFIKALTATDSSFVVARKFLAPDISEKWSPSDEVTIIDPSSYASPVTKEGSVKFTANRSAHIDANGGFAPDSGSIEYDFDLVPVGGQWRITNPPEDLIIDSTSFSSLYKEASVYFADPSGNRLVPDIRYFRNNLKQRANELVQALIAGPSDAIRDGVRNELGEGVKLRSAVDYKQNPLTIDLSGLSGKSEAQQRIACAQIVWTLQDLGETSVRITDDGEPLHLTGVGEVQASHDWESFDPTAYPVNASAYYLDDGAVHLDSTEAVPGPVGSGEYAITDAAVSIDGTQIAAVSAGSGTPVLRTGPINGQLTAVDLPGTTQLSAPTWGPSKDAFWIVRNGTEVLLVSATGVAKSVNSQAIATLGPVRRIALSRDGARLAIVAGVPGGAGRLYLATVRSGVDETVLFTPVPLAADLDVSAVAWRDSKTLAVLGRPTPTSGVFPYTMLIDDSQRRQLPPPVLSGETLALAAAPRKPFLCSINQSVLRLEDTAWVSLVSGIGVSGTRPFYPG